VILVLARTRTTSYAAAVVFVAGGLSDGLDGYVARRHGMTTRTGAWLDPLSDKLLVAAPMVTLTVLGDFPVWGTVLILAREAAVTALRVARGTRGASMPASEIAKVKTAAQLLVITLYLLPLPASADGFKLAILVLAVAITLYSGVDYFLRAARRPTVP
jgi:CDP-diacylglycerol--glycerol-3-phosphate 3-phosphatidyltransferase